MAGWTDSIAGFLGFARFAGTIAETLPEKPRPMFLDPGEAITALALVALYSKRGEEGIKLSFINNRIYRDHITFSRLSQAAKRTVQGTGHGQLRDLATALFHAIQWFKPKDNERFHSLFKLAQDGVQNLIDTYERSKSQEVPQYLFCTHLRMLQEGMRSDALSKEDYSVPSWEGKPLANESHRLWSKNDFELLARISNHFSEIVSEEGGSLSLKKDIPLEPRIGVIKSEIDTVLLPLMRYRDGLLSPDEEPAMACGGGASS